ncbi:MAG: DUF5711 family protein [Clostridiales bacterium]|nr:DUF5711 family protein [Clostridiales bacterium]
MEEKQENQTAARKDGERQKKETPGWLKVLLRILASIFTALLVALAVVLVLNRDQLNLDLVKRYLTYQALERTEEGQGVEFALSSETDNTYAALSDSLIVCNANHIWVYSDGGTAYVDMEAALAQPVIQTAGSYALVYDAGGGELYLFSGRMLVWEYETSGDYELISARVNDQGWIAVAEQATGYKAAVTVYDADQNKIVTENISSSFVMDAVVAPDNSQVALLTIGQDGMDFVSTLTLYSCTDGSETVSAQVSDGVILGLTWDDSGLWLQEESGVRRLDNELQELGSWTESSGYLQSYSLRDEYAVEYFSYYRSGALGEIVVLDDQGAVSGTLEMEGEVLSVTAAGRYIAVLTASELTVYTSDLEEYASMENSEGALRALARSDGTVMLIGSGTAHVFLP